MVSFLKCEAIRKECDLFIGFKLTDLQILRMSGAQELSFGDLQVLAVKNDGSGVLLYLYEDLDDSGEGQGGQVGVYQEVIVLGFHCFWQSYLIPGKRQRICVCVDSHCMVANKKTTE